MSYKEYLDCFGVEKKIENFKENVVNSKEFTNAFLDLTSNQNDEDRNNLFEAFMLKMEDVFKDNLK